MWDKWQKQGVSLIVVTLRRWWLDKHGSSGDCEKLSGSKCDLKAERTGCAGWFITGYDFKRKLKQLKVVELELQNSHRHIYTDINNINK